MTKPTIFISHITAEKEIAILFKNEIEKSFLGMVNVFVSSDAGSIQIGSNWLDDITSGLRECKAMLLFCSPDSIQKPWINFECGAGWGRAIDIVPVCHSGLRPVDLPLPMSLLQGLEASNPEKIQHVFDLISQKINCTSPTVNVLELAEKIQEFEKSYNISRKIVLNLLEIQKTEPGFIELLKKLHPNSLTPLFNVPQMNFIRVKTSFDNLQKESNIQYSANVASITFGGNSQGALMTINISITQEVFDALKTLS
ncbi:toll/interleukin-1 receptor domain-containing protein [Acetobacter ascendens]|uniref:toll/interleukin-1 receptor domain-containing protein n=1 Tax=Acetobacter ascendens TaxID=481146 RepID=UPI000875E389|nr:toll/interleukin-1 receptor domain-containing protein [Acetobacter ascendens]AOW48367.1 hypothetical protein A4R89_01940 [Acetobacter ascendens]